MVNEKLQDAQQEQKKYFLQVIKDTLKALVLVQLIARIPKKKLKIQDIHYFSLC